MDPIDSLGVFWLPGKEDDDLSGRLQFEPTSSGIELSLVGTFDNAVDVNTDPNGRIFGWIGSDRVTLDGCFLTKSNIRSPGVAESRYHANRMFVGHHVDARTDRFLSADVAFSHTGTWLNRSGIKVTHTYASERGAHDASYTASFTPVPEFYHSFSRGKIKVRHSWQQTGDSIEVTGIKQWPVFTFEYSELRTLKEISADVRNLQNLITLCIDTPVDNDRMVLTNPDVPMRMLDGSEPGFPQPIELLASPIPYTPPSERKPRHPYQMVLTFDEVGGVAAIARWLDLAPKFQRALNSLMSVQYAGTMFAENRFLNTTYGAEAFHRLTQDVPYMKQEEFDRILAACLDATPEEHREWLQGKIGYSNDPSLVKRLSRLAGRAGAATGPTIGKKDRWASTLSEVRNALTHLNARSPEFSGSDLRVLTDSVYAVVRTCMLLDCGVSMETLAEKADSEPLSWYRHRLEEAINRVREDLRRALQSG